DFGAPEKLFYRPIEAAIRWCELTIHEPLILESAWGNPERLSNDFRSGHACTRPSGRFWMPFEIESFRTEP
ncbi:hypothetical protein ACI6Q8_28240, partial [Pseudomonas amygdali pv. sesami]